MIPYQEEDELMQLLYTNLDVEDKERFILHFKLYLESGNDTTAFVVDMDDIWEWLGFSKKDKAKNVLLRKFEQDVDFICYLILKKGLKPDVTI